MKKLIPFVALTAVACGCASVDNYREGDVDAQDGIIDVSINPYKINYDYGKARVKGYGKSECWCWFFASNDGKHLTSPGFTFDSGLKAAKESATYSAVEDAKADALAGAMYRWTKTSKWLGFYKCVECNVIGFPAYVKGIEPIADRPVKLEKDEQVVRLKPWEKL